jgi:hypothetical protein
MEDRRNDLRVERWIRRAPTLIGMALSATLALVSVVADASVPRSSCFTGLERVSYSARFKLENQRAYRIQIGTNARAPSGMPMVQARIADENGQCVAMCLAQNMERQGPREPVSLELACRGVGLESLNTPVTILWANAAAAQELPALRLGSWLKGYETASLSVDLDQYSAPK